ncbi:MAG: TonB-dependent receptor [Bryobacterales bacterium]|nr:TonB-dependent receptor [Bryobacterales bacterium]
MRLCHAFVITALLVSAGPASYGQRILGEITGTVTDDSGATIVGAKITATESRTGRQWTVESNEAGIYRLVSLPAGSAYSLRIERPGFKTEEQQGVTVDVGEVRRADVRLVVGAVTESVTVTAEASALNLERGEVSAVVNQRSIVDLPLNGRNVYQLAELQPGVIRVAGSGLQESETTDARIGASGARFRDNQILLDGVSNNNDRQGGRTTITLNPDAVEQFRIVTNNLSAEYGRSGGALISVITRAGTNDLHGSAFWFLRNDNLDASNTFEARAGSQPEFKRNQFGATLGGPILRNRLFFFGSYQGLRLRQPQQRQATVETPEFRDFVLRTRPNSLAARLLRDFPPLANPNFNLRDIGSPAPGVRVAGPPDGIPDLGDVFIPVRGYTNDNQFSGRLDYTLNEGRDNFYARYSVNDQDRQSASGNSVRAFQATTLELDQNVGLNHTHIFSGTLTNDLRLGWNSDPQYTDGNFPEIPYVTMNVSGRSAALFSQTDGLVFPLDIRTNTYHIYDAMSWIAGRHAVKFGGEFRAFQENSDFPTNFKPTVAFEDLMDFADDEVLSVLARVDPGTGRPMGTYRNFRQKEFAFFLQDDWKITPRLTINLGLRYENFGSLREKNRKLSTLEFRSGSVRDAAIVERDPLYRRDNNNWAPRLGIAWDPTGSGKWSVRTGAGLFYNRIWSNFSGNTRFNTPYSMPVTLSALTPGQNPSAVYRIPFTGDPSFARPLDANNGSPALRPGLQAVDPTLVTPYNWQWFWGVQRRLPGDWVAEVNYLGNAGRKQLVRNELNRFSGDRADGAVNRVNQSFGSIIWGSNAVSSSYHAVTAQVTRRFSSGYLAQAAYTFGRSIDVDSEPFGGGSGEVQGSMEVNNLRLDRGLSAFDASHRLAANVVWEVPFLRGKPGLAGTLLGGWQLSSIVSLQSGFPFTVITNEDYNLDGAFNDRPNPAAALPRVPGSGPRAFSDGVFGPVGGWADLFRPAPAGSVPLLGRNTFRGPGFASADASLLKAWRAPGFASDASTIEFRAEFFNLFNRVNLRTPSNNSLGTFNAATQRWSNTNFGRSTLAFEGRQVQFAVKWRF